MDHYKFIKIVEKDSFINNFYKKHAEVVMYKRRFEDTMEAFSVMFRLSSDYILKKHKSNTKLDMIVREPKIYSSYTSPIEYKIKEEEQEHWTWVLKHKDVKRTSFFTKNKFYFNADKDSVSIDVLNCRKVIEDKKISKFIVESGDSFFANYKIVVNNLDDLEEILSRLMVLIN